MVRFVVATTNERGVVKQTRESVDETELWFVRRTLVHIVGLERATTLETLHVRQPINAFLLSNLSRILVVSRSARQQLLLRRASVCARVDTAPQSRRESRSLVLLFHCRC
jgi:hypothetical protein